MFLLTTSTRCPDACSCVSKLVDIYSLLDHRRASQKFAPATPAPSDIVERPAATVDSPTASHVPPPLSSCTSEPMRSSRRRLLLLNEVFMTAKEQSAWLNPANDKETRQDEGRHVQARDRPSPSAGLSVASQFCAFARVEASLVWVSVMNVLVVVVACVRIRTAYRRRCTTSTSARVVAITDGTARACRRVEVQRVGRAEVCQCCDVAQRQR